MDLRILKDFNFIKDLQFNYDSNNTIEELEDRISGLLKLKTQKYVYMEAINVIKAGIVSNMNYTEIMERIHKQLEDNDYKIACKELFDVDILTLFLYHLHKLYPGSVDSFIDVPRDIRSELKGTTKFSNTYSVTDEPVSNWDEYFFNVARQAARNSKCLSRRIGAVIVKDKSIISTGYNSPPRGVPRCDRRWIIDKNFSEKYKDSIPEGMDVKGLCPRQVLGAKSGELLKLCPAGHAEENAILNCAWHGISTKGASMYMSCGIPCHRCLTKIINAGISEIICTNTDFYDDNSEFLLNNSNIKVRLFNF